MEKIVIGDQAFGIAGAFLLGIFAAASGWNSYIFGILVAGAVGGGLLFLNQRRLMSKHMRKYATWLLIATSFGLFYYHAYAYWESSHSRMPNGKAIAFFGIIKDEPRPAGNFELLVINLSRPYSGTIDVFGSPRNRYNYGDLVWIKGNIVPSGDADEPPAVFYPQLRLVASDQGSWLEEKMIDTRSFIAERFDRVLPADQSALLAAITIGSANALSPSLKAQMEASGTSYIVGMYGYKIAIIIGMLAALLKDRVSKRVLFLATLAVIWLFVVASDANISVVRAAIMGSIVLIARVSGRIFSARNALMIAAMGMTIITPSILVDAAFQLSFLSFLGIYYLGPSLEHFFHWGDAGMLGWKEHAMLSLSTNLAILPIVIRTFGGFSLASFVSNILIMIPWALILVLGASIITMSFVSFSLTFFIARLADILLQYELFIIKLFSLVTMPIPAVFGSAFVAIFYYGALIIFAYSYATPSKENY